MNSTTLTNSFHNTSITIRMSPEEVQALRDYAAGGRYDQTMDRRVIAIRARLCGSRSCNCAETPLGERK